VLCDIVIVIHLPFNWRNDCGCFSFPLMLDLHYCRGNNNYLMAVYPGQRVWPSSRTVRNINPIYYLDCPHKHSQPSLPGLQPTYLYGLINRRTWGNGWKKHEEPKDKNPHFLYNRLILDVMKPLVKCWSPLTHASHHVTTSRPAAATDVSESNHSHVPHSGYPSCHNPLYFWA